MELMEYLEQKIERLRERITDPDEVSDEEALKIIMGEDGTNET